MLERRPITHSMNIRRTHSKLGLSISAQSLSVVYKKLHTADEPIAL